MIRSAHTRSTLLGVAVYVALMAAVLTLSSSSCAHPPPTLSPVGVKAFYATRAVSVLDVVRDTAIAAEAAQPPLLSTSSTRAIVEWHRAAVAAAGASPSGWQATVLTSLDVVTRALTPAERQLLAPYLALATTVLQEVR